MRSDSSSVGGWLEAHRGHVNVGLYTGGAAFLALGGLVALTPGESGDALLGLGGIVIAVALPWREWLGL